MRRSASIAPRQASKSAVLGELGVAIAGHPDRGQAFGRDLRRPALLAREGDDAGFEINRHRAWSSGSRRVGRDAVEDRLTLPTGAGPKRRIGGVEQSQRCGRRIGREGGGTDEEVGAGGEAAA